LGEAVRGAENWGGVEVDCCYFDEIAVCEHQGVEGGLGEVGED
jgi:hypothetical protein